MRASDRHDIEIELLIRTLQLRYGYDFSQYARASFKRRVNALLHRTGTAGVLDLIARLLDDDAFIREVVAAVSVPVSEVFRDPWVYLALRRKVLPVLATYPQINVWQAGCARGEEAYSLAILLKEEGLYERARIFATDFNDVALEIAAEGVYSAREARQWSENYQRAGGSGSLADYFHARYERIRFDAALRQNVVFASHNLAADGVFGEVQLILCRNVLIYFNLELQERVLRLFRASLVRGGFLCLGTKETLEYSGMAGDFQTVDAGASLYRLKPGRG